MILDVVLFMDVDAPPSSSVRLLIWKREIANETKTAMVNVRVFWTTEVPPRTFRFRRVFGKSDSDSTTIPSSAIGN